MERCMATRCAQGSDPMAAVTFSKTEHTRVSWARLLSQRKPLRRRFESPGIYSDDDANSDASSACSECSYSSRNGSIPHYLRQTEDVAEILNHCASSNWSERKEGLLGLQSLLKSQRILRCDSGLQAAPNVEAATLAGGSLDRVMEWLHVVQPSPPSHSRVELKRLCEIFTRMFADPHSKVRAAARLHDPPHSLGTLP